MHGLLKGCNYDLFRIGQCALTFMVVLDSNTSSMYLQPQVFRIRKSTVATLSTAKKYSHRVVPNKLQFLTLRESRVALKSLSGSLSLESSAWQSTGNTFAQDSPVFECDLFYETPPFYFVFAFKRASNKDMRR